jgi:hypothetical protein
MHAAWFYARDGRAEIFADGVCPEGWADTPAAFSDMVAEAQIESAATLVAEKPQPAHHPLDHDGDGHKGGSLPGAKRRPGRPAKARP